MSSVVISHVHVRPQPLQPAFAPESRFLISTKRARGVKLVGIDYLSVERFQPEKYETHEALLESDVVIVEGMDLRAVSTGKYELFCLPLKIDGGSGDGGPARAILRTLE